MFFRVTLSVYRSLRRTRCTLEDDCFDNLKHVSETFESLIFKSCRFNILKNTALGILCLYNGLYYTSLLKMEEFSCLQSVDVPIISA